MVPIPTRPTVLIVDDQLPVRELLAAALRRHQMRPLMAADGCEALATLESGDCVDALIVDLEMPNMDGPTLVRSLRSDGRYRNIPMLMISGSADLRERADAAGATAWMAKPFSMKTLVECVRGMLERRAG